MIVLVGNVATGKSTYAKTIIPKGYICMSRDAIRYMIGAGKYIFNTTLEPDIFASEVAILNQFMPSGINIVVDEVGMSPRLRKRYLDLAEQYHYKVEAHIMPKTTLEEAIKRKMNGSGCNHGNYQAKTWEVIWHKFDQAYIRPTKGEGFNKIVDVKKEDI